MRRMTKSSEEMAVVNPLQRTRLVQPRGMEKGSVHPLSIRLQCALCSWGTNSVDASLPDENPPMHATPIRFAVAFLVAISLLSATASPADELPGLKGRKRVIFLGDSITYSGQYIDVVGAYLAVKYPEPKCEMINLG